MAARKTQDAERERASRERRSSKITLPAWSLPAPGPLLASRPPPSTNSQGLQSCANRTARCTYSYRNAALGYLTKRRAAPMHLKSRPTAGGAGRTARKAGRRRRPSPLPRPPHLDRPARCAQRKRPRAEKAAASLPAEEGQNSPRGAGVSVGVCATRTANGPDGQERRRAGHVPPISRTQTARGREPHAMRCLQVWGPAHHRKRRKIDSCAHTRGKPGSGKQGRRTSLAPPYPRPTVVPPPPGPPQRGRGGASAARAKLDRTHAPRRCAPCRPWRCPSAATLLGRSTMPCVGSGLPPISSSPPHGAGHPARADVGAGKLLRKRESARHCAGTRKVLAQHVMPRQPRPRLETGGAGRQMCMINVLHVLARQDCWEPRALGPPDTNGQGLRLM